MNMAHSQHDLHTHPSQKNHEVMARPDSQVSDKINKGIFERYKGGFLILVKSHFFRVVYVTKCQETKARYKANCLH